MPQARDEAGNIWETDAQGNPVRLVTAAGGPQMPADPAFQFQGPQAAANLQRVQTQNTIERAKAPAEIEQATANAEKTRLEIQRLRQEIDAGGSPEQQAGLRDRLSRLEQLIGQINRVETLYDSSIGKTKGAKGVWDYFPTDDNARFDAAGAALSQQGLAAFRVPGTGTVSDRDALMFDRANLPTAGTRDSAIEEQLLGLRQRVEAEMGALGQPAPQWQGVEDTRPNAMTMNRFTQGGGNGGAAGYGATEGTTPIPPEMQAEYEALLPSVMRGGRFDPAAFAAMRSQLDRKYGFPDTGPDRYAAWAAETNTLLDRGGVTVSTTIPEPPRQLSQQEQNRNNLVNNPIGAAAAGAADMGSFGGVSALAPDQMAALGDQGGWTGAGLMAGQIGGAIGGTVALGKLGTETFGRVLPRLLGGGKGAQFGRNLATDVGYSGIYGGTTEGDPLTGAALGGIGSVGGQAIGKGVGRVIGGLDVSPAVQRLRDAGVRLTTGQTLGGIPRRLEDAFTSAPGIGDMAAARRLEGLQDFDRAAFREAGAPIGATVQNNGEEGVQELIDQAGGAYDSATAGVRVPLDPQFHADMGQVAAAARALPADYASRFDVVGRNRIGPIMDAGELTGEGYQQAFRGLKGSRSSAAGAAPGFEQEYRDALTLAMDGLTGQMQRGGGDSVVAGLGQADQAYRGAKTLQRAVQAAKNGTGSGEIQVFTPAQLNTASTQAANRFGGGRQFADLIDAGQSVLPSTIPDSGTGRRIATMALPTALGGTGAGIGGYTDGAEGAGTGALSGLALAALLMAGGTRGGQNALNAALTTRPAKAQMLGRATRKKAGLFGSASLPFLIAE